MVGGRDPEVLREVDLTVGPDVLDCSVALLALFSVMKLRLLNPGVSAAALASSRIPAGKIAHSRLNGLMPRATRSYPRSFANSKAGL